MSDPTRPRDELDDLLDAERELVPLAAGARARMRERLSAALPVGAMGDPRGGAGGGNGTGAPQAPGSPAAAAAHAGAAGLARAKLGVTLAAFALGAMTGAGGHALWTGRQAAAPPVASSSVVAAPAVTGAPMPAPAPTTAVLPPEPAREAVPATTIAATPRAASAVASARPAPSSDPDAPGHVDASLRSERALLERARTALTRSEPAAALDALRAHRARFPHGQLAEERDALEVTALRQQGDPAAARDAAKRFREDHPDSLLGGDLP
jgi:hypothetical protein